MSVYNIPYVKVKSQDYLPNTYSRYKNEYFECKFEIVDKDNDLQKFPILCMSIRNYYLVSYLIKMGMVKLYPVEHSFFISVLSQKIKKDCLYFAIHIGETDKVYALTPHIFYTGDIYVEHGCIDSIYVLGHD